MISQQRRNSLAQNILSRFANDHERCKRDGHRWVFGHCGLPERRESLQFSTCTAPAVRPLVPSSARGSDSGPRRFSGERTVPRCRLAAAFQSTECAAKSRCACLRSNTKNAQHPCQQGHGFNTIPGKSECLIHSRSRYNSCQDLGGWWRSRRRRPRCSGFGPGASLRSAPATQAPFPIMRYDKSRWSSPRTVQRSRAFR